MIENESQFTVVYSQPSVAEGKTINYATTLTDDPVGTLSLPLPKWANAYIDETKSFPE